MLKKSVGGVSSQYSPSQEIGVRSQETGDGRQETGDGRQETGDGIQLLGIGFEFSVLCLLTSAEV